MTASVLRPESRAFPRVLVVTNDLPPDAGGIQRYVEDFTARLPGPTRILAPRCDRARDRPERTAIARFDRRLLWPTGRTLRWIEHEAMRFAPDFVLFAAPLPTGLLGPRLRRRTGAPFGVLTHGAEVSVPAALPGGRRAIERVLQSADAIFANGKHTASLVERVARRPAVHIGVGVDAQRFRPGPRWARGGRSVVGAVGRFVPRKGHADVVRAVRALRDRGRDVEVLLVGTGRLEHRLRRLAAELHVPVCFEVDVPWERLPDLYRRMDVFALPCRSRWGGLESEGLGIVFLEAAATGLPVVVGNSGGAPETVCDGRTGFVVGDRAGLITALERLVDDPDGARQMGERGRDWVRGAFDWVEAVDRFVGSVAEATSAARSARG